MGNLGATGKVAVM